MTERPFNTGDKVRLKSGGPGMMVDWTARVHWPSTWTAAEQDRSVTHIPCVWFDGDGTMRAEALSVEILERDDRVSAEQFFASDAGKQLLAGYRGGTTRE